MERTADATPDDARATALSVAIRWLRHPASLAAIALLLLNDHVLKAEFGSWWTGKLSDVAGLVFAPALVAVALAAVARLAPRRTPRPATVAAAALAVVGVLFVATKATAVGAATASALLGHLVGPGLIRADATDLLALPALVAAWLSFRGSSRIDPARAPRPPRPARSRLATVLTLTVATGAVLASSAQLPARPSAVAIHGTNGVVTVTYQAFYGMNSPSIVATTDGVAWSVRCAEEGLRNCAYDYEDYLPETTPVCVPSQPATCFRPHPDAIAVDRSDDGGFTWHREWGLSDAERGRLDAALGVEGVDDYLRTMGVRILDLPGGYVVIAANGLDGLAVRHPDGTWERRGLLDSHCCSGYAFPPIDVSVEPPFDLGTSAGAASALAAWCLAFVLAVFSMRSRRPAPGGLGGRVMYGVREAIGALLAAAGVAGLAAAIVAFSGLFYEGAHLAPYNPHGMFGEGLFGVALLSAYMGAIGLAGAAAIVVASFVLPSYYSPDGRLALAAAAAATVATVVALQVGWTAHWVWIIVAATVVAFAGGFVATYLAPRRRADRGASPPDPIAYPPGTTFEP